MNVTRRTLLIALCALAAYGETPPESALEDSEQALSLPSTPTLASAVRSGVIPGASIALVDERGLLWSQGYGFENIQQRTRVTPDTAFWLASVTKTVTGTAIAHALERGRLSLDTDVSALVLSKAGFALAAAGGQPISLRQLVSHTSPIRDSLYYLCSYYVAPRHGAKQSLVSSFPALFTQQTGLPEEAAQGLCGQPITSGLAGFLRGYLADAGAYYSSDNFAVTAADGEVYSNVGAALAGYALELSIGESLADYAASQLFKPLGMTHTSWQQERQSPRPLATPYAWDSETSTHVELPTYSLSTWPDGGLRSSAKDLGRFLSMVIHGGTLGGKRVLEPSTVERMLTPLVPASEGGTGILWETLVTAEGSVLVGHDGSDPGATTLMLFDPAQRVGFVLLTNADEAGLPDDLLQTLSAELLEAAASLHKARR